jgi:regulator of RNase E activity RraB
MKLLKFRELIRDVTGIIDNQKKEVQSITVNLVTSGNRNENILIKIHISNNEIKILESELLNSFNYIYNNWKKFESGDQNNIMAKSIFKICFFYHLKIFKSNSKFNDFYDNIIERFGIEAFETQEYKLLRDKLQIQLRECSDYNKEDLDSLYKFLCE